MVNSAVTTIISLSVLFGLISGRGIPTDETTPPLRVQQCREGCLEKFATENFACMQRPECAVMDFSPPNLNNYIPEALRFLCWEQCLNPPPPKTHKLIPGAWPLRVVSMTRQGSLVSADVAWEPTINDASGQCLVTWEVSGGGLMGNLLTDSSTAELSLWPDTNYRVQVTCKNKATGMMSRSMPLTINTRKAIVIVRVPTVETTAVSSSNDSVLTNNPLKILEDSNREAEGDSDEEIINSIVHDHSSILEKVNNHIPSMVHSHLFTSTNLGSWTIRQTRREIIIALCASVILFMVFLSAFIFGRRRIRPSSDKEVLIENEIVPESRTLHV